MRHIIKQIKKGKAIPMSPTESLEAAINRTVKKMNTRDKVYWMMRKTAKVEHVKHRADKKGAWEAWGKGTIDIGWTDTKTDKFHKARPHSFEIHYKLGKDPKGLPQVDIMEDSMLTKLETDPIKMTGQVAATPPPVMVGEVKPQSVDTTKLTIEKTAAGKK